jgi:hypothetical protein
VNVYMLKKGRVPAQKTQQGLPKEGPKNPPPPSVVPNLLVKSSLLEKRRYREQLVNCISPVNERQYSPAKDREVMLKLTAMNNPSVHLLPAGIPVSSSLEAERRSNVPVECLPMVAGASPQKADEIIIVESS